MAGLASLGGAGSYIGKVRNDQLGNIFHRDLQSIGIEFSTTPAVDGSPTARCLVLVTPDGQRSMATYLGACTELGPEDINADTIRNHSITYLEGYLWDAPQAMEAMVMAAQLARDSGRRVALTLSDPFCVDRHRESFRELIREHVDILFANEDEIISLYQVGNVHEAVDRVRHDCPLTAVTRSDKGVDNSLRRGDPQHRHCAGGARCGHHRGRRPLRRRLPVRRDSRLRPANQRSHRRHSGGGDNQPRRGQAGDPT